MSLMLVFVETVVYLLWQLLTVAIHLTVYLSPCASSIIIHSCFIILIVIVVVCFFSLLLLSRTRWTGPSVVL